jgi:hypothetical protein
MMLGCILWTEGAGLRADGQGHSIWTTEQLKTSL